MWPANSEKMIMKDNNVDSYSNKSNIIRIVYELVRCNRDKFKLDLIAECYRIVSDKSHSKMYVCYVYMTT